MNIEGPRLDSSGNTGSFAPAAWKEIVPAAWKEGCGSSPEDKGKERPVKSSESPPPAAPGHYAQNFQPTSLLEFQDKNPSVTITTPTANNLPHPNCESRWFRAIFDVAVQVMAECAFSPLLDLFVAVHLSFCGSEPSQDVVLSRQPAHPFFSAPSRTTPKPQVTVIQRYHQL